MTSEPSLPQRNGVPAHVCAVSRPCERAFRRRPNGHCETYHLRCCPSCCMLAVRDERYDGSLSLISMQQWPKEKRCNMQQGRHVATPRDLDCMHVQRYGSTRPRMTAVSSGWTADACLLATVQQICRWATVYDYAIGTLNAPFRSRLASNTRPEAFVALVRPLRLPAYHRPPAVSGEEAFSCCHFSCALGGPTVCRQPCSRLLRFVLRHSMRRNESEACPHQVHEKNLARSQSCGT
ncbi:hypothetical protein GGI42DRAFT_80917 [Trichoderma sp. SZMC 28013]